MKQNLTNSDILYNANRYKQISKNMFPIKNLIWYFKANGVKPRQNDKK